MNNLLNLKLSDEEIHMLHGSHGPIIQKLMKTIVLYGEAVGAKKLVDIEGPGHFSIGDDIPGIGPRYEMLKTLVDAGLKTKYPFTLDPMPPLDFDNLNITEKQKIEFEKMYKRQNAYDEMILKIGLRDVDAYSCTCYLPQVNNIPKKGSILAWSESSCVVFANSVLGARTNRNAAIMDLLQNIVGKTPCFGFITDAGRKAKWLVKIKTTKLPPPQILGALIGQKVLEDVPYITGLDQFIGNEIDDAAVDYLKEMGAACAALGAVGLYHIHNLTPEAIEKGEKLLIADYKTFEITDHMINDLYNSYPVTWENKEAKPQKCFIGCPHLSLRELYIWTEKIGIALSQNKREKLEVPTILCAAPQVIKAFKKDEVSYHKLMETGAKLTCICPETYMDNQLCAKDAVITNSNKLRDVTTARLFLEDELIHIIATGNYRHEQI